MPETILDVRPQPSGDHKIEPRNINVRRYNSGVLISSTDARFWDGWRAQHSAPAVAPESEPTLCDVPAAARPCGHVVVPFVVVSTAGLLDARSHARAFAHDAAKDAWGTVPDLPGRI